MRLAPSQVASPESRVGPPTWDLGLATRDGGQAMVEFALILPLLALLTFGTLEVALYIQEQSAIDGASFFAARAASVLGDDKSGTSASLRSYTDATGIGWLQNASVTDGSSKSQGKAAYTVTAGSDRLAGMISGLSGGQVTGFDVVASGSVMPLDYDAKGFYRASQAATYKQNTLSMLEYPSFEKPASFSPTGAFNSVKAALRTIDDVIAAIQKAQQPKPAPKPNPAPKPAPGGGPAKPRPKPQPKPQPNPNPGGVPAPAPVLPPGFNQAFTLIDGGREPFTVRKAVAANPRRQNDKDTNHPDRPDGQTQIFQKDYAAPDYEDKDWNNPQKLADRVGFKMHNLRDELKTYEGVLNGDPKLLQGKASVKEVCTQVGRLAKPLQTNPLVKGALGNVDRWAKPLYNKMDTTYKQYDKKERGLFKR